MNPVAISVKNLSKSFEIRSRPTNMREAITASLLSPFRRSATDNFVSLDNVSFDVLVGEVVGIIGENGAGKSTLLKILSQITTPTSGEAYIHGRVASLLEIGTGFHDELTGHENVFLNGSILGMSKDEIAQKYDEIVTFSGIKKFIHTPIKKYSSGMKVRLAFSVAVHLEPEILLIDEVLAVGDAAFQQKCLSKMKNIAQDGRTILFVSHNLSAIETLCTRSIVLDQGKISKDTSTAEAISYYLNCVSQTPQLSEKGILTQQKNKSQVTFHNPVVTSNEKEHQSQIKIGDSIKFHFQYKVLEAVGVLENATFTASICDHFGQIIFSCHYSIEDYHKKGLSGTGTITCVTEPLKLIHGEYFINLDLKSPLIKVTAKKFARFNVIYGAQHRGRNTQVPLSSKQGYFAIESKWINKYES